MPAGSAAAVAFTASVFMTKQGERRLQFNVQWAMLLGLPKVVATSD